MFSIRRAKREHVPMGWSAGVNGTFVVGENTIIQRWVDIIYDSRIDLHSSDAVAVFPLLVVVIVVVGVLLLLFNFDFFLITSEHVVAKSRFTQPWHGRPI